MKTTCLAFTLPHPDTPRTSAHSRTNVTLDGSSSVQVDCYGAMISAQKVLWQSGILANGSHTMKIEFTGTANPAASKYPVLQVDAFDVTGTIQ
jgi:hypothetical protein